jgi:hypothetical protein
MRTRRVDATIFGAASLLALAVGSGTIDPVPAAESAPITAEEMPGLIGTWLNADSTVRLHLAADLSYVGSVAGRHRDAKGTYLPDGPGLLLQDVSGLRTRVVVADRRLEMAGHRLFRA